MSTTPSRAARADRHPHSATSSPTAAMSSPATASASRPRTDKHHAAADHDAASFPAVAVAAEGDHHHSQRRSSRRPRTTIPLAATTMDSAAILTDSRIPTHLVGVAHWHARRREWLQAPASGAAPRTPVTLRRDAYLDVYTKLVKERKPLAAGRGLPLQQLLELIVEGWKQEGMLPETFAPPPSPPPNPESYYRTYLAHAHPGDAEPPASTLEWLGGLFRGLLAPISAATPASASASAETQQTRGRRSLASYLRGGERSARGS
ncbi:hypothetical protein AMAG_00155 [Allomyces macrogynus ATCC 38327]|uniref:Gag1-like clamp domain-containing protein n=1 Tax=Allomyces macrogynus (strain ATCC 38327) TaxID=578462 RepID=A0A0L0RUS7_ALLM3|nr:hypothetical protein AMAG_00155 [Allomyces macrogynus ATCC 38327]|eukprot:KNE54157.1 hypothetical protein AMAG_00155 [Allomyces macrogynus ATCC 38327]